MMYRRDDAVTQGPNFAIRQVDDVMCSAAADSDRKAVLNGIAATVTFKISRSPPLSSTRQIWSKRLNTFAFTPSHTFGPVY
jgi:hypothetical protein